MMPKKPADLPEEALRLGARFAACDSEKEMQEIWNGVPVLPEGWKPQHALWVANVAYARKRFIDEERALLN